jgi:hypothetical protein
MMKSAKNRPLTLSTKKRKKMRGRTLFRASTAYSIRVSSSFSSINHSINMAPEIN